MNTGVIVGIVVAVVVIIGVIVAVIWFGGDDSDGDTTKKDDVVEQEKFQVGAVAPAAAPTGVAVVPSGIAGRAGGAAYAVAPGVAAAAPVPEGNTAPISAIDGAPASSLPTISPVIAKTPTEIVVPTTVEDASNYLRNDLYPPADTEDVPVYRPSNSMYTHLETNFLDVGPQIGVGTRVNSHRNGAQLIFRRQFQVPTVPTGYWNQSVISQPIFTNNVC